jgi:hypothetical protein
MMRVDEGSTGRVPGAAKAAIVSPAIPTSQCITPSDITTFPPTDNQIEHAPSLPLWTLAFAARSSTALGAPPILLRDRGASMPDFTGRGNEPGNGLGSPLARFASPVLPGVAPAPPSARAPGFCGGAAASGGGARSPGHPFR